MDLLTWVRARQVGNVEQALEEERKKQELAEALLKKTANKDKKSAAQEFIRTLDLINPDILKQLHDIEGISEVLADAMEVRQTEIKDSLISKNPAHKCVTCGVMTQSYDTDVSFNTGVAICDKCYK